MSNKSFEAGQRLWLTSGQIVEFVGPAGEGRCVVAKVIEYDMDDDDEPCDELGDEIVVSVEKLRTSVPREKLDADLLALRGQIDATRNELCALQDAVRDAQKEQVEIRKRLSVNAALSRVDDWLAGRMTHFVKISEYERIEPVTKAELLKEEDRSRDLRLLCLFGRTNGNLQWRVNRWSDGSGSSWTDVIPFANYEDAFAFCAAEIPKRLAIADNDYRRDNLVESAQKLGIAIDQRHIDEARARRVAAAQKNLDSALSGVAELRKKLEEAQS